MDKMIKNILIKVIAAVCVYLTMSISTASAIEVSIYRQITEGTPVGDPITASFDPSDIIDKSFEFEIDPSDIRGESVKVKISVTGTDSKYPINKIYLFKCKDNDPLGCLDYAPVEAVNELVGEKGTFFWRDSSVSRDAKANFLTLVKIRHEGVDSWIGFWDNAWRTGIHGFHHKTYVFSDVEVYANPGLDISHIKSYIEKHYMIPGSWTYRAFLNSVEDAKSGEEFSVSSLYEVATDGEDLDALLFRQRTRPQENVVEFFSRDYTFDFSRGTVAHPLTFIKNPAPEPGDGQCDVGEDPQTSCADCGCPGDPDTVSCTDNICHICGDDIIDIVENSENCCADAGCPDGLYCSGEAPGQCTEPTCGNGVCEPLEFDAATYCAEDCYDEPGKTCQDVFGSKYYYSPTDRLCVKAVCGNGEWEPAGGETVDNCCIDNPSPDSECRQVRGDGWYCDAVSEKCVAAGCGNGDCEAAGGENQENCCNDCGCPIWDNEEMTCDTANFICHACGNKIIELPVETDPATYCCQDAGCDSGYCAVTSRCEDEVDMRMNAKVLPAVINCKTPGTPRITFTPENAPHFFDSFVRASYTDEGGLYNLKNCVEETGTYVCDFPLSHSACFESPGQKAIDFIVTVKYFNDMAGEENNELKSNEVPASLDVELEETGERPCLRDGVCDVDTGENDVSCCFDCPCGGLDVCTTDGCLGEDQITLSVSSVPAGNIDCRPSGDFQNTDDAVFVLRIDPLPDSSDYKFGIVSESIEYEDEIFTGRDIPGFECIPLMTETPGGKSYPNGLIECTIPVAYFPPCRKGGAPSGERDTAEISFSLNILGGGLLKSSNIEGKPLSVDLNVGYIHGLPLCGNGIKDGISFGETQDNCCQDMGCPDDKSCTADGCIALTDINITATIDDIIDCSVAPEEDPREKTISLGIRMNHEPYSPSTNGAILGENVYIGGYRIGEMQQGKQERYQCAPTTEEGHSEWLCTIPTANFIPFCWISGWTTQTVEAQLSWQNTESRSVRIDVSDDVTFKIDPARQRDCDGMNGCEAKEGEAPDICCLDCGCTGADKVCTIDNVCVDTDEVALNIRDVSPDGLDCGAPDNDENNLVLTVEILNAPDNLRDILWEMLYEGETIPEERFFACNEGFDKFGDPTGYYECVMSVNKFPACWSTGVKTLTLTAWMRYRNEVGGETKKIEASGDFKVTVATAGYPSCGNGDCEAAVGEKQQNCCQDCGCNSADGDICTESGFCLFERDMELVVENKRLTAECQLIPGRINYDTYSIEDYGCIFEEAVQLDEVYIKNKKDGSYVSPVDATVTTTSYRWNKEKTYNYGMDFGSTMGWNNPQKFYITLNPDRSYEVDPTKAGSKKDTGTIDQVSVTIQSSSRGRYETVLELTSDDETDVDISLVWSDTLLDQKEILESLREAVEQANKITCVVTTILATCVVCSLMAGGAQPDAAGEEATKDIPSTAKIQSCLVKCDSKFVVDDPNLNEVAINHCKNECLSPLQTQEEETQSAGTGIYTPMARGSGGFGGIHPKMFTNLMMATMGSGTTGGLISGLIGGGLFALASWQILDCSDNYIYAIGGAAVVCGALVLTNNPKVLEAITNTCDTLSMGLYLLDMLTKLQRSSLNYHICMIGAQSSLARGQATASTGYDMAQRTQRYYQQLAACHHDASNNMNNLMHDYSRFTYGMSQYTGLAEPNVQMRPQPGSVIRPGSAITVYVNLPPDFRRYDQRQSIYSGWYGDRRGQGVVDIFFDNIKCSDNTRILSADNNAQFYLRDTSDRITCLAVQDGLDCRAMGTVRSDDIEIRCRGDAVLKSGTIYVRLNGMLLGDRPYYFESDVQQTGGETGSDT